MLPLAPRASSPQDEIERYLKTGRCDLDYAAWPGDLFERARRAHEDLRGALVAEVRRLASGHSVPEPLGELDIVAFTRRKVGAHGSWPLSPR